MHSKSEKKRKTEKRVAATDNLVRRSMAVPLVPVKERLAAEMKTIPIDRPRSTTPINPSSLEEYVAPGSAPGAGATPAAGKLAPAPPRERQNDV